MKFGNFVLVFFLATSLDAQNSVKMENTNFMLSQGSYIPTENRRYLYNYNRFRLYYDWSKENYFVNITGDIVNYFAGDFTQSQSFTYIDTLHSDTPITTQSHFYHYDSGAIAMKWYRCYGGYENDSHRVVVGLQNIVMGVGHIWTPSNLFNPKNIYALEPDETLGVIAFFYTYYLNGMSQIYGVISRRKDKSTKYALGYKTSFDTVDIAFNAMHSNHTDMLAYTLEGDLGNTGMEVRSEGAYIIDSILENGEKTRFFQGILGADYAFEQGLNLTVETMYSSKIFSYDVLRSNVNQMFAANLARSHVYLGATFGYDFSISWSASLLWIESTHHETSRFIAPVLSYTVNDSSTLSVGAMLYGGSQNSEFGIQQNSYYVKYVLSY